MTKKDAKQLASEIDNEGFGYAFLHASSFEEIKDEKFHKLRKAFVKAGEALEEYLDSQGALP